MNALITDKFSKIYAENEWGYGSGVGSLPLNNADYIKFIKLFIERNSISSVVDFGCGDWQFSRFIDWAGADYLGLDVVESVIDRNQAQFGNQKTSFLVFTPEMDLPVADLIICKDVFQHLPNRLVWQYLDLFKARARFVLITNDDWPAQNLINTDIDEGGWRPILLDREPFCQMAPIVLSWMIEWGGWKPTRKATCLILGDRHSARSCGNGLEMHLINLDRSVARLAEFQKRNGHLHHVIRFAAVDGKSIDRDRLIEDGLISHDLGYSEGAVGCALSHIALWKLSIDQNRPITIAEDDAVFARDFDPLDGAVGWSSGLGHRNVGI